MMATFCLKKDKVKNTFQIFGMVIIFLTILVPSSSYGQIKIGDLHKGGIVFSVDGSGQHGMVCQTEDLGILDWNEAVAACKELGDGWALPTIDQLKLLYINLHKEDLGSFINDYYWSATEWSSKEDIKDKAWFENFANGDSDPVSKDRTRYVRAIRVF
ncbi:MAG: hypothetical protein ACI81W_000323 [Saprospiraceae bacterium]|jgi:hypothetical protein